MTCDPADNDDDEPKLRNHTAECIALRDAGYQHCTGGALCRAARAKSERELREYEND